MTGLDNPVATGGAAVIAVAMIQALKNCDRPWAKWISRETATLNLWLGIGVAFATSIGIHVVHEAGNWTISFSTHEVWQALIQWATQQITYKGFVVPAEALGEIRTLLERGFTPPPESEGAAKVQEHKP